jgi:serine phosphatase RsbU (regulator of sigma subunit)
MNGKGIAASMNMVILKSVIRTFLSEIKDFKQLVEKVNLFIRDELPKGSYFAGMFALVDFSTDTMYYINCGTPALFVYTKAYNNVIEVQGEGKILGFAKDIGPLIKVKKVKLAPGDVVVSCTDGLIETQSIRNEAFGKERVQRSLIENLMYPAGKIAQFTYDALVKFTSKELDDDITIFVMKYLGGSK